MPTVPRYNQQIQDKPINVGRVSTDASLDAFGGGSTVTEVSKSIVDLSQSVDSIFQNYKKQADGLAVDKAKADLINKTNELTYNTKDGVVTRKNKDAFGISEEFNKRYEDEANTIEAGLTNPQQKAAFRPFRVSNGLQFQESNLRYETGERQKWDDTTTKTNVETYQNDAALNWAVPGKIDQAITEQEKVLRSYAERNDVPPEVLDKRIADSKSATVTGAIQNMISGGGNDLTAKNYYDLASKKGWLTAEDDTKIQGWLKTATTRAEGQRFSDDLIAKGVSYGAGLQKIHTIEDPETRQQARSNFVQYHSDIENARDLADKNNFETSFQIAADKNDPDAIPADRWSNMKPQYRKAIEEYTSQKRNGVLIQTDPDVKDALWKAASNPDTRTKFANSSLLQYRHLLSDGDYQELEQLHNGINKNDSKALGEVDQYVRTSSQFQAVLKEAKIDTSTKKGKKKEAELSVALWNNVQAFHAQNDRWPNETELTAETKKLVTKVTRDALGPFNPDVYNFQLGTTDEVIVKYKKIPEAYRTMIENGMRRRKMQVTPEAVIERYKNWLRGHQ